MIFGINIITLLGIINMILVLFQLLSGLKIIKVKYKLHKTLGIILFFTALGHGVFAMLI